jgi:hypothetical protein
METGMVTDRHAANVQKPFELVDPLLKDVIVKPRKSSILGADLGQDLNRPAALEDLRDRMLLRLRQGLRQLRCG